MSSRLRSDRDTRCCARAPAPCTRSARARVGNSVFPADGTPLRPLAWTSTASPSRSRAGPRTRSPSCETRSLARRRRTAAATRARGATRTRRRDYSVDRTRGASRGFRRPFPSTTSSLWARVRLVRHRSRGSRWFKSRAGRVTRRASPKPARVTPGVKGRFTPSGTVIARVNARLAFWTPLPPTVASFCACRAACGTPPPSSRLAVASPRAWSSRLPTSTAISTFSTVRSSPGATVNQVNSAWATRRRRRRRRSRLDRLVNREARCVT